MVDLYLVQTPRQWWLAHAIAAQKQNDSILIVYENIEGSDCLVTATSKTLFKAVFSIKGGNKYREASFFNWIRRRFKWFFQKKILQNVIKNHTVRKIFSANTYSIFTQYLLFKTNSREEAVSCTYIDDGFGSYLPSTRKQFSSFELFLKKIKYGFPLKNSDGMGVSPWVEEGYVLYPELVTYPLANGNVNRIDRKSLKDEEVLSVVKKLVDISGLKEGFSQCDLLIVLDLTSDVSGSFSGYKNALISFVKRQISNGKRVFVKPHPRDKGGVLFKNLRSVGAFEVPSIIPVEAIFPMLPETSEIISGVSTASIEAMNYRHRIIVSKNSRHQDVIGFLKSSGQTLEFWESVSND